jgi:hypothetical protein
VTVAGSLVAAGFYTPTAIGYVQLPGVILFTVVGLICVACFLACPLKPIFFKNATLALMAHSLFWVLFAWCYYSLHVRYGA